MPVVNDVIIIALRRHCDLYSKYVNPRDPRDIVVVAFSLFQGMFGFIANLDRCPSSTVECAFLGMSNTTKIVEIIPRVMTCTVYLFLDE